MYCKNLLKRQRQNKTVFYCKNIKGYIDYRVDCKNCSESNLVRMRHINKIGKKRIFVKKEIYEEVFKRDEGKCRLCGTSLNLHLHHIVYRSENKNLINELTNCIMLCARCHRLVHSNKHYWQPKLKEIINKYESEEN